MQSAPHSNYNRKHQTDKFHICTGEMKAFPLNSSLLVNQPQFVSAWCEDWVLSTMLYVFFTLYVAFAASENPDGKTCLYNLLSRLRLHA